MVFESVGDMWENGSSVKGKKTTLRDVDTMLENIRREKHGDIPDSKRAESVLHEFVSQQEGNSAVMYVEEDTQVAAAVVFQSARMERLFQTFPEVVLGDTTHNTNANKYKLFSFA
ncbi:hypothetical protein PHMEG_00035228, partial [Phytophthora megakarya]